MTKFDCVAIGIDYEPGFADRARIRIIREPFPANLLLLRLDRGRRKIIVGDLETPNDSFHRPNGCRRQSIVLQRETKPWMIRDSEKDDHGDFSIETADIQVGVKAKPRAHER